MKGIMEKKLQTIEFDVDDYLHASGSEEMIEELEGRSYTVLEKHKPDQDFPKLIKYLCDVFGISYQDKERNSKVKKEFKARLRNTNL